MISLKQLLYIDPPSSRRLLDIAIILSIIPHIFVMKLFMVLYIAIALIFILKKNKSSKDQYILMLIGLLLISISFFNNYNFSNFSRMQFFVSLVSSLLIYAVTLQKLKDDINIYLKISPSLLMLLSFFFYNSITMLIYTIFVLFIFTLLMIWMRMDAKLIELIKLTSRLFVLSLPVVVILFLVFPRISFKKAEFGFRADTYNASGYDGKMDVSSKGISLSNKVVMEVFFENEKISDAQLYFRGSTLYKEVGGEWVKSDMKLPPDRLSDIANVIKYDITLYPHADKWVYTLDLPFIQTQDTYLEYDYTLKSKKPVYEKKKYSLSSALSYKLKSANYKSALEVDLQKNDQTYKALHDIRDSSVTKEEKARMLLDFFRGLNISYKLRNLNLDENDMTDSFLFEEKNGYCVHFASAFAKSARMLGIPSRVVTGFKAERENMINNYLIVKEKDAHAWVELYFDEEGWVRFEPTATAVKIEQSTQEQIIKEKSLFQDINLKFMYVKYLIDKWILGYDRLKQLEILKSLLSDTIFLMKFILSILGVFAFTFLIYINIKSTSKKDVFMQEIYSLLKVLKKHGLEKNEYETMGEFLKRSEEELGFSFVEISEIYHRHKYSKHNSLSDLDELKAQIKEFTTSR